MYAEFFGLTKDPFSIAPDPRFLYMSEKHREALAHLLYGVGGGGGFVLLTGEIGAGKTTVCRAFLEQIPKNCDVAYIFNPKLTVPELLQTVCEEFHIALPLQPAAAGGPLTVKDYVDAINRFLLASHAKKRSAVLIIDEAQSLAPDVLEQLRLLTNLETHERKLLQIILIGQPELRDMLASPGLEQLAQRVIARCHLSALTAGETVRYVQHRLSVAGGKGGGATVPFDPEAMSRLFQLTGGVPRRINLLAGRAMLGAYAHGRSVVDKTTVENAAGEVFDVRRGGGARPSSGRSGRGSRPHSSSSAPGGTSRPGGPASSGGSTAADGERAPRRFGLGAWAAAAAVALGLGIAAWGWRDGPAEGRSATALGGAAAASAAAAGTAPGAASGAGAGATSGATSGASGALASSPGHAAAAPAGNGVLAATASDKFDDPAMLLAAAWTDEPSAWRALAMAWKSPLPEGEVCGRAAGAVGLACYRTRGGLAAVRQLDRPGLVWLRARDEPPVVALLVAIDERGVTLQTQGRHWRLSPTALAGVWRGEFATLWRTPPGWRGALAAASAPMLPAPTRAWVHERLADAGLGDAARPMPERLWAYQVAQGLPPDGRPGPTTLMQLGRSASAPAAEPVLLAQRAAGATGAGAVAVQPTRDATPAAMSATMPSAAPTMAPAAAPAGGATAVPAAGPTAAPTAGPSAVPAAAPTAVPAAASTEAAAASARGR
jgi:general secretion pathway protein A